MPVDNRLLFSQFLSFLFIDYIRRIQDELLLAVSQPNQQSHHIYLNKKNSLYSGNEVCHGHEIIDDNSFCTRHKLLNRQLHGRRLNTVRQHKRLKCFKRNQFKWSSITSSNVIMFIPTSRNQSMSYWIHFFQIDQWSLG